LVDVLRSKPEKAAADVHEAGAATAAREGDGFPPPERAVLPPSAAAETTAPSDAPTVKTRITVRTAAAMKMAHAIVVLGCARTAVLAPARRGMADQCDTDASLSKSTSVTPLLSVRLTPVGAVTAGAANANEDGLSAPTLTPVA